VLRKLHLWTALIAGIVIVALGLSGSALVFRADLERWLVRDWLSPAPVDGRLSLDELVDSARTADPARSVTRLHWPAGEHGTLEVVTQQPGARNLVEAQLRSFYVHPGDGRILGTRDRAGGVLWWLQELHYSLFGGERGLKVNGIFAGALLALAVTGPVLWWPGWKRRRDALRVRRRPTPAFWRDLHAVGGAASCVLLALFALTAMYYTFRVPATALITAAAGDEPLRTPAVAPLEGEPASLDALLSAARATLPAAQIDEFRPPRSNSSPAIVSFRRATDAIPGRHRLYLHPISAGVIRIDDFAGLPRSSRWLGSVGPLHFGTFGGRASQWLWFMAGLVPAFLMASGSWLWWRRRRATRAPV
jgi:uncharacterized iron-regulated membrane protein